MNLLYAVSWYYSGTSSEARGFYEKLRRGAAQGKAFPIDGPYEVALVHVLPNPDSYWLVAVLALRSTPGDDSIDTVNRINAWFAACEASGWEDKETRRATALSVETELGSGYDVEQRFGTFAGEPSLGDLEPLAVEAPAVEATTPAPPVAPAPTVSAPVEIAAAPQVTLPAAEAAPSEAAAAEPLTFPPSRVVADVIAATVPPARPAPASPTTTNVNSCFGVILTVLGGLLVAGGLVTGLLFLIGQMAGESENTFGEFLVALACLPLPVVITGVVLLGVGVFLLRRKAAR